MTLHLLFIVLRSKWYCLIIDLNFSISYIGIHEHTRTTNTYPSPHTHIHTHTHTHIYHTHTHTHTTQTHYRDTLFRGYRIYCYTESFLKYTVLLSCMIKCRSWGTEKWRSGCIINLHTHTTHLTLGRWWGWGDILPDHHSHQTRGYVPWLQPQPFGQTGSLWQPEMEDGSECLCSQQYHKSHEHTHR